MTIANGMSELRSVNRTLGSQKRLFEIMDFFNSFFTCNVEIQILNGILIRLLTVVKKLDFAFFPVYYLGHLREFL